MLAVKDMHAIVTCARPNLFGNVFELRYGLGQPSFRVSAGKKTCLDKNRILLDKLDIKRLMPGPDGLAIDSIRHLKGHVLGLMENPASVSRIAFYGEDATFVAQIQPDGSILEASHHEIGPDWDFTIYTYEDTH